VTPAACFCALTQSSHSDTSLGSSFHLLSSSEAAFTFAGGFASGAALLPKPFGSFSDLQSTSHGRLGSATCTGTRPVPTDRIGAVAHQRAHATKRMLCKAPGQQNLRAP